MVQEGQGGWAVRAHQAEDPSLMVLVISVWPPPADLVSFLPCGLASFAHILSHRDLGFCFVFVSIGGNRKRAAGSSGEHGKIHTRLMKGCEEASHRGGASQSPMKGVLRS